MVGQPTTRPERDATAVPSARRVVTVSLLVDLADIVTNLFVALLTGSAVVFAEMAQGTADTIGSLLLLVGERRSRLPGDARYPAGHTREVFFWALLSALVMLVLGSGLSFWRGFTQLAERAPLENPWLALGVLMLSVATNGYAASQSYRRLRAAGGKLREAFREESQPLVKTAFLQDSLGTASAATGLVSLLLYSAFGALPVFDAAGAIAIAVLMVGFGIVLVTQMHHFITGRPVPATTRKAIRSAALTLGEVEHVNGLSATFTGSDTIVADIDLDLCDDLTTSEIERVLDRLHEVIRGVEPRVVKLRVDLNSPIVVEGSGDGAERV
jgi:cation diffusion facilitator family transporter